MSKSCVLVTFGQLGVVHLYLRFIIDYFLRLRRFFAEALSTNPQHAGPTCVGLVGTKATFSVRFEPALTSWDRQRECFVFFTKGSSVLTSWHVIHSRPSLANLGTKPWESNFKSILQLLKLRCHQAESLAERSRWNLTIFVLHVSS